MDKDLLRLVILGMGSVLIVGILLWGILANRKRKRSPKVSKRQKPLDHLDDSLSIKADADDFDLIPLGSANTQEETDDFPSIHRDAELNLDRDDQLVATDPVTPTIIQFSIVAKTELGFNGNNLAAAFKTVGLQYSNLKIFQHLDITGQPEYAVASMVEPGTFPTQDLADFICPGIVFFMQPTELPNPIEVYDQMISSINHLASLLDGIEWDSERQALTIKTIQIIRNTLDA